MKKIISIFLTVLCLHSFAQSEIPALNKKIVDYVTTVIGKKVDHGECWDLANRALTNFNAKWDGAYKYGQKVDPSKDEIFPGDIIQFSNVVLKFEKDGMKNTETMAHHTAIVYKVLGKGIYQIADQNTSQHGRKVGLSDFNLADMTKGKAVFYRPQANQD